MLFSDDAVAKFIQDSFEPVWESVRPVPLLTIDFGNGKIITRTLHGNIASYVCSQDGEVLDILPGMYSPTTYLEQLHQLWLLHAFLQKKNPGERDMALRDYHRTQAEALRKNLIPGKFTEVDFSKIKIERSAKNLMVIFNPPQAQPSTPQQSKKDVIKTTGNKQETKDKGKGVIELPAKRMVANSANASSSQPQVKDQNVSNWQELVQDTLFNERTRRLQIHQKLADHASPHPSAITKWLYAEVLHADLDDPYLGLGSLLNQNYPFQQGEKR